MFPTCFCILLVVTNNWKVAVFATLTLMGIIGNVLGMLSYVFMWKFDAVFAIAGTLSIGFSVDYLIHVAHMYHE